MYPGFFFQTIDCVYMRQNIVFSSIKYKAPLLPFERAKSVKKKSLYRQIILMQTSDCKTSSLSKIGLATSRANFANLLSLDVTKIL